MENIIWFIATAFVSGLLATVITLWWQRRTQLRVNKMKVFETLMSYRYMLTAQESVNAINSIDIVFYKDKNVRKAYTEFINEAGKNPESNPDTYDKYLKLLEEMSNALGLKQIYWYDIKQIYYPINLAQKIKDEEILRKLQIQNSIETVQRNLDKQNTPADKQFNEQMLIQLFAELIKNPDIVEKIFDIMKNNRRKNDTRSQENN